MIEVPFIRHVRGMILSGLVYAFLISTLVAGPIEASKYIFPSLIPLKLSLGQFYEVPLDVISFHILVIFTGEYCQPGKLIKNATTKWFRVVGGGLDLTSYLFAETAAAVVKPKGFPWRIGDLFVAGIATLFAFNVTILLLPVSIGRFLLWPTMGTEVSDVYTFLVGFYTLWITVATVNLIKRNFNSQSIGQLIVASLNIFLIAVKWGVLLTLWLGLIPLLIGLLLDMAVLVVIRSHPNESPHIFLFHDWAFGLVYLKIWFRLVMLDTIPTSWKATFDKVQTNGIRGVNVSEVVKEVILPIFLPFSIMLSLPYTFSRGIVPLFAPNIYWQSVFNRYSHLVTLGAFLGHHLLRFVVYWYPQFKQAIIDDKYLIGHRLHNLSAR